MKKINSKFIVRKFQCGWIVTRKSDDFKIYFEDFAELMKFTNN